jgi:hypothetical protein
VVPADPELAFGAAVEPSELELFELELPELLELELPELDDDLAEDEPAVPDDALPVLVRADPGS